MSVRAICSGAEITICLKGKIRSCKYRFCTNEISSCTIKFIYSSSIHFWVHLNFPILYVGLLFVSYLSLLVDVLLDCNAAKLAVFLASKTKVSSIMEECASMIERF